MCDMLGKVCRCLVLGGEGEGWGLGGHYARLVDAERWWPAEQEGRPMSCERAQALLFAQEDKRKFNMLV